MALGPEPAGGGGGGDTGGRRGRFRSLGRQQQVDGDLGPRQLQDSVHRVLLSALLLVPLQLRLGAAWQEFWLP